MHDLNTIKQLNVDAFAPWIKRTQEEGKFVVATYTGLHILSVESFAAEKQAIEALHAEVSSPDQHRELFSPTLSARGETPTRDQSDDRFFATQA